MDTEYLIRIDGENFAWRIDDEHTVDKLRALLTECEYIKVFEVRFREYRKTSVAEVIEESFQGDGTSFHRISEKLRESLTDNGFAVE